MKKYGGRSKFECKEYNPKLPELAMLLESYNLGIASFDSNLIKKLKEELKEAIIKSKNVFSVFEKNKLIGLCFVKRLEWDTNFFGYNCACVDFCFCSPAHPKDRASTYSLLADCLIKWLRSNDIKFGYAKIDVRDHILISSLENMGFKVIEEVSSFYFNFKKMRELARPEGSFRIANSSDIHHLQEIAPQSTFNRFVKDKMFSEKEVRRFRGEWVKNLVNGSSNFVILSMDGEIISGFNACEIDKENNIGRIKLIVVDKKYIGSGNGKRLVNKSIWEFKKLGVDYLFVSTQSDNVAACSLYPKCGFENAPAMITLHYWSQQEKDKKSMKIV